MHTERARASLVPTRLIRPRPNPRPCPQRLNLTQREFGILLSPLGQNPISPSVICQLESALQSVPQPLVNRAVAATTSLH